MSKGNMFLGHARGKVGDIVFSRANGEQIVRARAAVVKNPKTEAQTIQRIILNTIAQAYSKMSEITDHSFEGVSPGQKSMSMFMKTNMNAMREKIAEELAAGGDYDAVSAFTPLGTNTFMPNVYVIAKGSLPEIKADLSGTDLSAHINGDFTSYQSVIDTFGLQRGDQVTLISFEGTRTLGLSFYFARVILDPRYADGSKAALSVPFVADGAINLPSPRNEGEFAQLTAASTGLSYKFSTHNCTMAAVIVSRQKSDGTWMRSNSSMALKESEAAFYGYSLQYCLDTANGGDLGTLSARFLNNAGTSNLAGDASSVLFRVLKAGTYQVDSASSPTSAITAALAEATETVGVVSVEQKNFDDGLALVASGTDGKQYIISSTGPGRHRGKVLASFSGTVSSAWNSPAPLVCDDFTDPVTSITIKHALLVSNGGDPDTIIDAQVERLHQLGVDYTVFVNP